MKLTVSRRRVLASAVALAALRSPLRATAAAPVDVSIVLGSDSLTYAGLRIANELGLFEKHGVRVTLSSMDSGANATSAMIAGSSQFSGSGPSEILAARARRQDVLIVAGLYRGMTGSLILGKAVAEGLAVRRDQPVADRLKALDGLVIASPSQSSVMTAPVVQGAAKFGGRPKVVYMAQAAMPAAMETSAIQGFVSAAPFSDVPIAKGTGVIWVNGPKGEFPSEFTPAISICVQCMRAYADANPAVVRAIQDALADLARIIRTDPDTAQTALGRAYPRLEAPILARSFEQDSANWAQPIVSVADLEHERQLFAATASIPGLDKLDLALALRMPS